MYVHSATGYDLCSLQLICCRIIIENCHFRHTCIVGRNLQKELMKGFMIEVPLVQ